LNWVVEYDKSAYGFSSYSENKFPVALLWDAVGYRAQPCEFAVVTKLSAADCKINNPAPGHRLLDSIC